MFELHNHSIVFAKYLQDSQMASKQCSAPWRGQNALQSWGQGKHTFLGERSAAAAGVPGPFALGHFGKTWVAGYISYGYLWFYLLNWSLFVCLFKNNVVPRSPFPGSMVWSPCHSSGCPAPWGWASVWCRVFTVTNKDGFGLFCPQLHSRGALGPDSCLGWTWASLSPFRKEVGIMAEMS